MFLTQLTDFAFIEIFNVLAFLFFKSHQLQRCEKGLDKNGNVGLIKPSYVKGVIIPKSKVKA